MSNNYLASYYQRMPAFNINVNIQRTQPVTEPVEVIKTVEDLLRYAEKKHQCQFSAEFVEKVTGVDEEGKPKIKWLPDAKIVDALVKEWHIWEPYVSSDSYSGFIADGIYYMSKIQSTATSFSPNLQAYVGKKAKIVKETPKITTYVTKRGEVFFNGRPA